MLSFSPKPPPLKPKRAGQNEIPPNQKSPRERTMTSAQPKTQVIVPKKSRTTTVSMTLSNLTFSSLRKKEILEIWFRLPGSDRKITLQVSSKCNSSEIKKQLILDASKFVNGIREDDYVLHVIGINYNLENETLPLHRDKIIQLCYKAYVTPKLEMITRENVNNTEAFDAKADGKKKLLSEITLNTDIASLLDGELLSTYLNFENPEISSFRRNITLYRINLLQEQGQPANIYPEYVRNEPLPMTIPPKILFLCYFPNGRGTTQLAVKPTDTSDEITLMVIKKFEKTYPQEQGKSALDYILKVTGKEEYLLGQTQAIDYDFIRKGSSKSSAIEVSLILRDTLAISSPESVQSLNTEESLLDKMMIVYDEEEDEESSWKDIADLDQPFRILLYSIEGLEQDLFRSSTSSQSSFSSSSSSLDLASPSSPPLGPSNSLNSIGRLGSSGPISLGNTRVQTSSPNMMLPLSHLVARAPELSQSQVSIGGGSSNGSQTERSARDNNLASVYVTFELFHAGISLFPACSSQTSPVSSSGSANWKDWISLCPLRSIPRGARLCITLFKKADAGSNQTPSSLNKDVPIAWVNQQIIDHRGYLRNSVNLIGMWPVDKLNPVNPLGTPLQNLSHKAKPSLRLSYEPFDYSVKFSDPPRTFTPDQRARIQEMNIEPIPVLDSIISQDSLTDLTSEEKRVLFQGRDYCSQRAAALPKFLSSVTWSDTYQVKEAYKLIQIWAKPNPIQAMELLDAKYPDPCVRNYAVGIIDTLPDCDILDLMLQLTQVLKHEGYHDSALARFLLRRALANKKIGHAFYWHLKSELHLPQIAERYILLLEAFLRGISLWNRKDLIRQDDLINKLNAAAERVKKASDKRAQLSADLKKINFSEPYTLPLDQRMVVRGINAEKSKTMDSKKQPLWLVFKNDEEVAKPITVIFKSGDDLRQDVLTLQMLRLMDKLWKREGLDLRMHPYGCIATGNEVGMIEVVLNADTTANINKAYGGPKAVLYKDTLSKWLQSHNPSTAEFEKARRNFEYSCAGYCVATYVLGIGDRHNDNIMMTKAGHLFRIFFTHNLCHVYCSCSKKSPSS
eukprot:TRINITY_DN5541_c0_g2_i1.p1 TRINITY_DN5541_c0_g2~~TRINITY_DN5541_c0_g2_i1.p1  ORF type:complete len:1076 (+),score=197.79 TRINITY_DN5541_c0_g2_i1:18-3245(+)